MKRIFGFVKGGPITRFFIIVNIFLFIGLLIVMGLKWRTNDWVNFYTLDPIFASIDSAFLKPVIEPFKIPFSTI